MKPEKKAVKIASFWAFLLAVTKFTFWIISWSMTLLASAADSLLDLMVSILNLFALKESAKPADKEHNYWHWKIEGIAAVIELKGPRTRQLMNELVELGKIESIGTTKDRRYKKISQ